MYLSRGVQAARSLLSSLTARPRPESCTSAREGVFWCRMNWSDERYVRLFTRDTVTWLRWSFETRAVFCLLLRKVDRSGVLETGRGDKAEALALTLMAPIEVCRKAIAELTSCGTLAASDTSLVVPRFIEAQECRMSDKARQKESREKRAAAKIQNHEDVCHTPSHDVTAGHTVSHAVTPAVPYRAVPYRTVPETTAPLFASRPPESPEADKPSKDSDLLVADFKAVVGSDYLWQGAKDGTALAALLKAASIGEVRNRWRRGLSAPAASWASCRTVAELRSKWNHLGEPTRDLTKGVAPVSDWATIGEDGGAF